MNSVLAPYYHGFSLSFSADALLDGTDTLNGTDGNVENLVGGSAGGNLKGKGAAKRIDGGLGAEKMTGLAGDDFCIVNGAGDSIVAAAAGLALTAADFQII